MHCREMWYVIKIKHFNVKGSNEIWQVAGNYGKWQQIMGRNMKNKIVNKKITGGMDI